MLKERSFQLATTQSELVRVREKLTTSPWMLLLPVLALYALVLVYPLFWLFVTSIKAEAGYGFVNYIQLFDTPVFATIVYRSFVIAFQVTLACIIIGYPLAYVIHHSKPRIRAIMMAAVVAPVLVGALIRSFAWIAILEDGGVVNAALIKSGVIDNPISLVYNRLGLMIGMINVMLPFCVLPMVAEMRSIDQRLVPAAASLGATPLMSFVKIFLPLSAQGVTAGALLTFLMSLGFYITPALLGGRKESMIAQLLQMQVMDLGQFNVAAAMGWILIFTTIAFLWAYSRFFDIAVLFGGKTQ